MGDTETALHGECKYLAKQVLWKNGADSNDVVETLAAQFFELAQDHQQFVREQRESDEVIAAAVRYIADVHAMPAFGADTGWFRNTLHALLELAVPNTGLTSEAARLLPWLQEGIAESLADAPISRNSVRVDEDAARSIHAFEEVGCQNVGVAALLDLVEKLYHGDTLSTEDKTLFRVAAVAAPMTRQARIDKGLTG
ncbi:hypothetical protein [Ottowia sp.]|uniref:hypothetical protein n=1 Tax=Ottowia sp. TaxID=1898956 RepID=UPI0025E77E9D|nr:hypothetical protein [Ottowia sp.]MBK6616101.1 hypothetical protein [Ottowia sp.]